MHHADLVRRLIRLRRKHESLRSDNIRFHAYDFAKKKLICYDRWLGELDNPQHDIVSIALNFDNIPSVLPLKLPHGGSWLDIISGQKHQARRNQVRLTLEPWSAAVLVPVSGQESSCMSVNGHGGI
jgi:hypothetical protein